MDGVQVVPQKIDGLLSFGPRFGREPEKQERMVPDTRLMAFLQAIPFHFLASSLIDERQHSIVGAFQSKHQESKSGFFHFRE